MEFLNNSGLASYINLGNTMTNGIITIYLVAALASEMAKFYKKNQMNAILISLLAFFIVTPLTVFEVGEAPVEAFTLQYLGSRGCSLG